LTSPTTKKIKSQKFTFGSKTSFFANNKKNFSITILIEGRWNNLLPLTATLEMTGGQLPKGRWNNLLPLTTKKGGLK
jgi:hypothetical protein